MTNERWMELMSSDDTSLMKAEIEEGWHFCYDFDGLLVGPGMGEMLICSCARVRAAQMVERLGRALEVNARRRVKLLRQLRDVVRQEQDREKEAVNNNEKGEA